MQILQLSEELRSNARDLKRIEPTSEKPVVITWGLMNAGKSYLLNMLTEHIEKEFFKTNDFRETAELKAYDTPLCTYLDTPGLDANEDDDTVAFDGIKKADVILFVHQLQGELESIEVDFLKGIKTSFGQYAEQNIILVLSKIDKEEEEKVNEIEARMLQQCQENLGFQPKCFKISNKYYQDGVKKNKDGLIRHSHIDDLKKHLSSVLDMSFQVRQERKNQERKQLIKQMLQCRGDIKKEITQKRLNMLEGFTDFENAIHDLVTFIEDKADQYLSID